MAAGARRPLLCASLVCLTPRASATAGIAACCPACLPAWPEGCGLPGEAVRRAAADTAAVASIAAGRVHPLAHRQAARWRRASWRDAAALPRAQPRARPGEHTWRLRRTPEPAPDEPVDAAACSTRTPAPPAVPTWASEAAEGARNCTRCRVLRELVAPGKSVLRVWASSLAAGERQLDCCARGVR